MNTNENTGEEKEMEPGSPLSALNETNPFAVNDLYFEDFNKRLNERILEMEELKTIAPTLISMPVYNPFKTPEGYFDELPAIIQTNIPVESPSFSFKEWLFLLIKPNFALPVLITIFISIAGIHFVNKQVTIRDNYMASDISDEEQLYPIDEATLVDLLSNTNTVDEKAEEPIENYLLDNNIDETILNTDPNISENENQ